MGVIDADFGLGFVVRESGEGLKRERRGGRGGGYHVKRRVDRGIRDTHAHICRRHHRTDMKEFFVALE